MSKQKTDKKTPAKPATDHKKTGKVTKVDDLELNKIVGGGFADPANNCVME